MLILIPVIIITLIVGVSFGASHFRNVNLESTDPSSLGGAVRDFLDLDLNFPSLREETEEQQDSAPPVIQEPQE